MEQDYIQRPVDEAYSTGIQSMGSNGPTVGLSDWFNALAHMLTSASLARGGIGNSNNALERLVTLYRGENTPSGKSPISWLPPRSIGRWFTPSKENSAWYAKDTPQGRIVRVRVPESVDQLSRMENQPDAARFSLMPSMERFLPPYWAGQAKLK